MKLGIENRKQTIAAAVLGAVLVLVVIYEFWPSSSTSASAPTTSITSELTPPAAKGRAPHNPKNASAKKEKLPQSLDPTLHLNELEATEQIKYEGSGRNIFVSQTETEIVKPMGNGTTDQNSQEAHTYTPPPIPAAPPIPLKFFGFASGPGEPKKAFLSKGDDFFVAGEGEIVDRRYKVVKISATSVEIQDVVSSGPPQSIPLSQGNPS
ncbi:MAG: hypothetical protein ACLQLC_01495 [Candidatus Sulfotelmatobacter sp.]